MSFFQNKFIIIFLLFLFSCNQSIEKSQKKLTRQESININKNFIELEYNIIKNYIEQHELQMQQTKTGIYHTLLSSFAGEYPTKGKVVSLIMDIYLLDGTIIYSYGHNKAYKFKVDINDLPRGINEIIKLLKVGENVKFILPSHLAYGVLGDGNKIPPKSPLYYDVTLTDIK